MNKERIALAHQIIDGIPARAIKLDGWRKRKGSSLACRTICCAAGWLALHPTFNAMGLRATAAGVPETENNQYPFSALQEIFGGHTYNIFSMRGSSQYDVEILKENHKMTDKQLALARMKKAYYEA